MSGPTLLESYRTRPFRFLEAWELHGRRLKVYGIRYGGGRPLGELVAAARTRVDAHLAGLPRDGDHGVGFVGVHQGRGANFVLLDRWCHENELAHRFWTSPPEAPAALRDPDPGQPGVCVWDLHLQYQERQAWVECVLANPRGPDLEAYLARRYEGEA